jgi:hypothetical protein
VSQKLLLVTLGALLTGLIGCDIKTPEIRGTVLDAETKQPVKGAWVRATIEVNTKTIAGDIHSSLSIDKPHTRTNERGIFVIPSRSFNKPGLPMGFGTHVVNVAIGASTVEDRGGRINIKKEQLDDFLKKAEVEVVIYSHPVERTEAEYFSHLQSLYSYCLTGRSSVEVPPVEGGCDEWELNYAIAKHERYLETYKKDAVEGKVKGFSAALEQLAELYEKKGNFTMSIEVLKRKISLIQERGLLRYQEWQKEKRNIERKIDELQLKLRNSKNAGVLYGHYEKEGLYSYLFFTAGPFPIFSIGGFS